MEQSDEGGRREGNRSNISGAKNQNFEMVEGGKYFKKNKDYYKCIETGTE